FSCPMTFKMVQYVTVIFVVLIFRRLKLIHHDKNLDVPTIRKLFLSVFLFHLSIFANNTLLRGSDLSTFVAVRSATPLLVAAGEMVFLRRPPPPSGKCLSLVAMLIGVLVYSLNDRRKRLSFGGGFWGVACLVSMSSDFVYIKHVLMSSDLSTWDFVLYNNVEALALFPLEMLANSYGAGGTAEIHFRRRCDWYSGRVISGIGVSCLFGSGVCFLGFRCRRAVSATGFAIVTVVVSVAFLERELSGAGVAGIAIFTGGGILY
ncbi:hypothetical protein M569_15531, partial [Genlisea aurea]